MTPPMYRRVHDLLLEQSEVDDGPLSLLSGFTFQRITWTDPGKGAGRFIVFRSGGGSPIDKAVSSDYYVMVDVISAKGIGEYDKADNAANLIVDFFKENPIHKCLGQITNLGGIPAPVQTTEGRLVYRLMFACLYGD